MNSALLVIRHAKAEAQASSGRDFDRALSAKGRRQAQRLNDWLSQRLQNEDQQRWLAIYSPAVRTQQTTDIALADLDQVRTQSDPRVWNAAVNDLVESLSQHSTESAGTLLIGHNPGLEQLIYKLSGQLRPMSTASIIELALNPEPGRARMIGQFRPEID